MVRTVLTCILVALALAGPATAQSGCPAPGAQTQAALLSGINTARAQSGRTALRLSPALARAAQGHACDMLRRGYFSHKAPGGGTMSSRIKAAGYTACRASENIAKGQQGAGQVIAAWMGSRGHKRNILDKRVADVGFGMAGSGRNRTWVMVSGKGC